MIKKLLWIDIETTGLEPTRDTILEIALAITIDLEVVASTSFLVKHERVAELKNDCGDFVRGLHAANGLWTALEDATMSLDVVERECIDFISRRFDTTKMYSRPVMAGSNPRFDKDFLTAQMPLLDRALHYRTFDMNALYMFFDIPKDTVNTRNHRAMDDLQDDIRALTKIVEGLK
jgi:oligoribonuclease